MHVDYILKIYFFENEGRIWFKTNSTKSQQSETISTVGSQKLENLIWMQGML